VSGGAFSELSCEELQTFRAAGRPIVLVDCREGWERELARLPDSQHFPLGQLVARADELEVPAGHEVVVYCHHGVRSRTGAAAIAAAGLRAHSLTGGIDAWSRRIDPGVPRY